MKKLIHLNLIHCSELQIIIVFSEINNLQQYKKSKRLINKNLVFLEIKNFQQQKKNKKKINKNLIPYLVLQMSALTNHLILYLLLQLLALINHLTPYLVLQMLSLTNNLTHYSQMHKLKPIFFLINQLQINKRRLMNLNKRIKNKNNLHQRQTYLLDLLLKLLLEQVCCLIKCKNNKLKETVLIL